MSALKPYFARCYLMLAKRMRCNAIRNFATYLSNLPLFRHVRIIYIKKAPAMLGLFKYFKQKITRKMNQNQKGTPTNRLRLQHHLR